MLGCGKFVSVGGDFVVQQVVELLWACRLVVSVACVHVVEFGCRACVPGCGLCSQQHWVTGQNFSRGIAPACVCVNHTRLMCLWSNTHICLCLVLRVNVTWRSWRHGKVALGPSFWDYLLSVVVAAAAAVCWRRRQGVPWSVACLASADLAVYGESCQELSCQTGGTHSSPSALVDVRGCRQ